MSVRVFAARQLYVIPVHLFPSGAQHGCSDGMEDHVGGFTHLSGPHSWHSWPTNIWKRMIGKERNWGILFLAKAYVQFWLLISAAFAGHDAMPSGDPPGVGRRSISSQRKHQRRDVTFSMMLSRGIPVK